MNILEKYYTLGTKELNIHNTYVKESDIQGNGLFANKDLDEGKLITLYPAHYIFDNHNKKLLYGVKTPDNIIKKYEYEYDLPNGISIAGDPNIMNNPSFLGHIANDGYRSYSTTNNNKNRNKYNKNSKEKNNSYFNIHKGVLQLNAYKNIKKDEEILVGYGFNYWMSHDTK